MRFTASEEAGNPDADLSCRMIQCVFVTGKELLKMPPQLTRNDVFLQFVFQICFIVLRDLHNSVDISVDIVCKQFSDLHRHLKSY